MGLQREPHRDRDRQEPGLQAVVPVGRPFRHQRRWRQGFRHLDRAGLGGRLPGAGSDGDGKITSGKELFGNFTVPGATNGFAALRQLAGNPRFGYVDADHGGELFARLLLWHDRNQNGESEPNELTSAAETLDAIGLGYTDFKRRDGAGNYYRYAGWARTVWDKPAGMNPKAAIRPRLESAPAREFRIYDVFLTAPR